MERDRDEFAARGIRTVSDGRAGGPADSTPAAATGVAAAAEAVLQPRARLLDVLRGRASLVGARLAPGERPGFISPVEARLRMGLGYGDLVAEERHYLEADERSFGADVRAVAKAAWAAAMAPSRDAPELAQPAIVAATVDNITIDEALDAIVESTLTERSKIVFFVHAHALNLATLDRAFARSLAHGDLVLPDGIGIRLAARILGVSMRDNLNGTDLLPLLCQAAVRAGRSLVLVGGADGVATACAERLRRDAPGLQIPIARSGFLDEAAIDEVVLEIARLDRPIVLIGMGSPLQERFVLEHLRGLGGATVITVGGLFDFFSGRMPRAPIAWREAGLEWLYRLGQEPRRMGRRYLLGNPVFLGLAVAQRAGLLARIGRGPLPRDRS